MARETPENEVKRAIKDTLHALGILPKKEALAALHKGAVDIAGYYRMPVPGQMSETGVADFIVCVSGRYVEIEAKAVYSGGKSKGHQTLNQKFQQRVVTASGGIYFLVTGVKEAGMPLHLILKAVLNGKA